MKKYGLRLASFVLCLAVGSGFVWLIAFKAGGGPFPDKRFNGPHFEVDTITVRNRKKGLEIRFREFVETGDGIAADFEVTNYDYEFYVFSAYPPENENAPVVTLPKIKLDGQELYEFRCGTGLRDYILKSGETKIFRYNTELLALRWRREKSFQISFYFRKENEKEFKEYWSENLPISGSIEGLLLKKQKEYGVE